MRAASLLLVLMALVTPASAAPGSADTLRRDVQKAMRLRTPAERASAVGRAFEGHDSGEAADVAVDLVFGEPEGQLVLDAAMGAVARMENQAVVGVLRAAAESGPLPRRLRAVEALGRSQASGASGALAPLSADASAIIRTAVVNALGRRDESVVPTVEASLADSSFTVRSAAVSALSRLGRRRSVGPLCDAMRASDGRLVDDCLAALRTITGQRLGPDPARYEKWLADEEKATFAPPPAWTAPAFSFESPVVVTRSRRILFALSTSETMKDPVSGAAADAGVVAVVKAAGEDLAKDLAAAKSKLDVARVHLRTMLRTLKDGVEFDVLVYSGSPAFAFGEMTAANAATRKRAEGRIASLSPGGAANLHGALVRAFDPRGKDPFTAEGGPDTVVLFTDGALAEPGSTDPTEVAMSAVRWNAVRQIRFLVVATGQAEDTVISRLASGPPDGVSASVP